MRRQVALTTLLFFATLCLAADTERFSHIKIHRHRSAENRVLVDKLGTLTNGFEMELEGGKTYDFLQNTFQGVFKWETKLSHNSAELVIYRMIGTYVSDWSRK